MSGAVRPNRRVMGQNMRNGDAIMPHVMLATPLATRVAHVSPKRGGVSPTAFFRGFRGFTYIGVLIAIAVLGVWLAVAGSVWHTAQQRDRERELLFAGDEIRNAIGRYYNAGHGAAREYPQNLEALLRDPRQPSVIRYLRKIYIDPMTDSTDWGLVKTAGDRIAGIYSKSDLTPIKQANFGMADGDFEGKKKYSEWLFVYQSRSTRTKEVNKTSTESDMSVADPETGTPQ